MIEKYGLFDSQEGDERVYAETDFALLAKALGLDGVRGGADALKVTPMASGLGVEVAAGLAIIRGRDLAEVRERGRSFLRDLTLTGVNKAGEPLKSNIAFLRDNTDRILKF